MGFKKKIEDKAKIKFSIDYEAHLLAWYRDNGLVELVQARLAELAYYEQRFGRISMAGKRSGDLPEKEGYPQDLREWCIKEGAQIDDVSSYKIYKNFLYEKEQNRKSKLSPGPTRDQLKFGSHPADRELLKKFDDTTAAEIKYRMGWHSLDPSIPVRKTSMFVGGKGKKEVKFEIPKAEEGHLAKHYGIEPTIEDIAL